MTKYNFYLDKKSIIQASVYAAEEDDIYICTIDCDLEKLDDTIDCLQATADATIISIAKKTGLFRKNNKKTEKDIN